MRPLTLASRALPAVSNSVANIARPPMAMTAPGPGNGMSTTPRAVVAPPTTPSDVRYTRLALGFFRIASRADRAARRVNPGVAWPRFLVVCVLTCFTRARHTPMVSQQDTKGPKVAARENSPERRRRGGTASFAPPFSVSPPSPRGDHIRSLLLRKRAHQIFYLRDRRAGGRAHDRRGERARNVCPA